jgi:outer membrane protein assembly factor BamB
MITGRDDVGETGVRNVRQPLVPAARLRKAPLLLACLGALALTACGEREVILEGERFDPRTPLDASVRADDAAAPTAPPPGPANQSVPISLPAPVANADWTHRAANARHLMPHAALSSSPARVWSVSVGQGSTRRARVSAAPIVADGRVFAMDALSRLTALTPAGGMLWSVDLSAAFDRGGQQSSGGLAAAGGRVFAATGFGELVALDPASGEVLWRQRLDSPVSGAPAAVGDQVFVVGRDGGAWGIDAASGKVAWTVPGTGARLGVIGTSAPSAGERSVIFPSAGGELMAVTRLGGLRVWASSIAGERNGRAFAATFDVTGDPVVAGDVLYAGTSAGRTVAMSASSGEKLWSAGEGALGPVLPVGGSVFLVSDEARLVRLDAATGATLWSVEMPYLEKDRPKRRKGTFAHYGPVLAGGRLVVASSDGLLRFFSPEDGSLVSTLDIPGGAASQPAVAGGTLYVTGANGQLHAFR